MLKLIWLTKEYEKQAVDMLEEWTQTDEEIVPSSICRVGYKNFDEYLEGFNEELEGRIEGYVPSTTLFGLDTERNILVGAVNIRHALNENLLLRGGHIGDGVRPTERRKGYATQMIALALEECKRLGIDKVLMTCDKSNVGSAKSIMNNGGVLENEIEINGVMSQRYWIRL